jgi:hypothetical protein
MLKNKIVALLTEADREVSKEFFDCEFKEEEWEYDSDYSKAFRQVLKDENITFEEVDRYGGEDEGSEYWSVYSFTDGMQVVFIKFDGWYASYDGSTYEEFYEVQPVEKTITVFEKK